MPMTGLDRKAELIRNSKRQSDIARALGVSSTAVSDVVSGRSRSARIEQAVAEAIGRPVEDVFPQREPRPEHVALSA